MEKKASKHTKKRKTDQLVEQNISPFLIGLNPRLVLHNQLLLKPGQPVDILKFILGHDA